MAVSLDLRKADQMVILWEVIMVGKLVVLKDI
jgi:hypothetical protein